MSNCHARRKRASSSQGCESFASCSLDPCIHAEMTKKNINSGEVPEWLNGADSKSDGAKAHGGSNPSLSASLKNTSETGVF